MTTEEQIARTGRAGPPLLAAALLLPVIAIVVWIAPLRGDFYGRYVCSRCGVQQKVQRRSFAGVSYSQRITVSETAVSRALRARQAPPCQHEWRLLHFGAGHQCWFGAWEHGDGGTDLLTAEMLIRDDDFGRELARTPRPREAWALVWEAGQRSPEATEDLLWDWWSEGPDREPFDTWWASHEQSVRQLARPASPEGAGSRR